MDKANRERIDELCSRIATEQNQHKFLALVEELNRILSAKAERLKNNPLGNTKVD